MPVHAQQATDPITFHGEGPFWDARLSRLLLVDMLEGVVVEVDGSTAIRHQVGTVAAAIRARESGGYVVGVERGFRVLDSAFQAIGDELVAFRDRTIRMNDGGCDPQGRFYCGTMAYSADEGRGTLYRLDPDQSIHTVLEGVTISNGLQWSADGTTVFYNDTPTGRISAFRFDPESGALQDRRTFAEIEGDGMPDGLAIDAEDGLWVALYGGSAVRHYTSDGRLAQTIQLPVTNVTACAFGGPDLGTLYITTSREGLDPGQQPTAGSVFEYRTDVAGAVQHPFAG